MFQSTRPCGARLLLNNLTQTIARFQSTRPCGARPAIPFPVYFDDMFQSTRPCGARLIRLVILTKLRHVSIHAPLRGATRPKFRAAPEGAGFNPRAPAGRDWMLLGSQSIYCKFQSTRPCGARRVC